MPRGALDRVKSAIMARHHSAVSALDPATDRATVAAGFVTGMLSGLAARGEEVRTLLEGAGVPAAVLRKRDARVPVASYAALFNAVVAHLGDESLALFAQPLRRGAFEFLARSCLGSRDLAEALERAARFLDLVRPELAVSLEHEGGVARLVIAERGRPWPRPRDPRRVFAFEWLLRLLHALACWLVARPLPLDEVAFPFPKPPHAADYALIYAERSRFGAARLEATFDAALLALPVRREASDVESFLDGAPGRIALLYRRDREVARAVRERLARSLPDMPAFEAVARELGLSPRSLHRRLRDEGTSFREVKAALRRALALSRLEKSSESVAGIAASLGYSEPSAFFRAFCAWTGVAPSVHRRKRRAGAGPLP
jgi:AraC-like DNA-binding protein